jgi:hypothetical protein
MATALSLIGIISLLAGGIVEGALRYANVVTCRCVVSLFVVPGLYSVSVRLLKRCNNRFARILSPGDRESRKNILGFEASGNYKYVGMQSGTDAPVANALFESWMNFANRNPPLNNSVMFRARPKMGFKSTLGVTRCNIRDDISTTIFIEDPFYIAASFVCQMGAIAVFVLMVVEGDPAGITINVANMVAYFLINIVVTRETFSIPVPDPADNVPPGDIMVTNKLNNNIWVVRGNEVDIQSVAQKEIKTQGKTHELAETVVYIYASLTAIATILVVPIMSKTSQVFIAIQFGIGLLSSIIFSSRDGEKMLKSLLDKHYIMDDPIDITFTNRATAVAAAVFSTNANVRYIYRNMVPETQDYDQYREMLQAVVSDMGTNDTQLQTFANELKRNDGSYLKGDQRESIELEVVTRFVQALPGATDMLPGGQVTQRGLNTWPGRLLMDIVEAFAEIYVIQTADNRYRLGDAIRP